MDITSEFRLAAADTEIKLSADPFEKPDKNRILRTSKKRRRLSDPLESRAKEIVEHVSELHKFLAEHRVAYIDVLNPEYSSNALSNIERDKIDAGATTFIQTTNALISAFKKDLKAAKHLSAQRTKHLESVCDLLDDYLRSACQKHSRQKAIRIEKEVQFQKLSRLELTAKQLRGVGADEPTRMQPVKEEQVQNSNSAIYGWSDDDEEEVAPEEMQKFEQENVDLYKNLTSIHDEVQRIETKVVKIAELQEFFTQNVLEQCDGIEAIHAHAVASSENLTDANEELRKAIQRNASTRVYVLFFLIVMSFSLLFLDWYND